MAPAPHLLTPTTRLSQWVTLLTRLLLGAVFVTAGALKVGSPEASARAVQAYQLLPFDVATYTGYALPLLEIIVGALLLVGLFTRAGAVVSGLLLVAFIIGIASAWARGISIDCGCFGDGGTVSAEATAYPQEIARDVALLAAAGWLAWRPAHRASLDRLLFDGAH